MYYLIKTCIFILFLKRHYRAVESVSEFEVTFNTCLPSQSALHVLRKVSAKQCMEECKAVTNCTAVVYKRHFQLCELYSAVGRNVTEVSTSSECTLMELRTADIRQNRTDCGDGTDGIGGQEKYCGKRFCPALNLPNGTLFGNMNAVGSRVTYTCNKYLNEVSLNTGSVCQQNGTWTRIPVCRQYFQYLGCYKDNDTRVINSQVTNYALLTTEYCLNLCFDRGYVYASTQATDWCFCGNEPRFLEKTSETDCDLKCKGDSSEFCGGHWRGSLYRRV